MYVLIANKLKNIFDKRSRTKFQSFKRTHKLLRKYFVHTESEQKEKNTRKPACKSKVAMEEASGGNVESKRNTEDFVKRIKWWTDHKRSFATVAIISCIVLFFGPNIHTCTQRAREKENEKW